MNTALYLITPPVIADPAAFASVLDDVLASAEVACVQLRLKDVDDDTILAAGRAIQPVCEKHDTALLVNDRADLAKALEADGVHLGQSDGSVEAARKTMGYDCDIGVTCHDSMHLAFEAGEAGADYVAFGAFFDSGTKDTEHTAELALLERWRDIAEIPSVAIGGITAENCGPLIGAGADFIAVSGAVWQHADGPVAGVKALMAAIETADAVVAAIDAEQNEQ